MSVWVRPSTAPMIIETIATPHSTPRHSQCDDWKPTASTRRIPPNAATLVQAAMNAVTGVGAPWYTSGVQVWNGPTEPLNSGPTTSTPNPPNSKASERSVPAAALAMSASRTEPANPYSNARPYRKNAEANAPSRKYLTAASW